MQEELGWGGTGRDGALSLASQRLHSAAAAAAAAAGQSALNPWRRERFGTERLVVMSICGPAKIPKRHALPAPNSKKPESQPQPPAPPPNDPRPTSPADYTAASSPKAPLAPRSPQPKPRNGQVPSQPSAPPAPADDGLVEGQFRDLLKFLINWLQKEKPHLLRRHNFYYSGASDLDQDLLLTNVEIYLSEELKLRSTQAFERWLVSRSSDRFDDGIKFNVDDKPARFLCALKSADTMGFLSEQIRLFHSRRRAEAEVPPPRAEEEYPHPPTIYAANTHNKHSCPVCAVSMFFRRFLFSYADFL
jgi:hypothetical protein